MHNCALELPKLGCFFPIKVQFFSRSFVKSKVYIYTYIYIYIHQIKINIFFIHLCWFPSQVGTFLNFSCFKFIRSCLSLRGRCFSEAWEFYWFGLRPMESSRYQWDLGWQKGHGGRVSQGQLLRSIFCFVLFLGLKDCEEWEIWSFSDCLCHFLHHVFSCLLFDVSFQLEFQKLLSCLDDFGMSSGWFCAFYIWIRWFGLR